MSKSEISRTLVVQSRSMGLGTKSNKLLRATATLWFVITLIGQWIFVFYVANYFGGILIEKGVLGMKDTHLPHGYVEGDLFGNIAIATHVMLAIIVMRFGPLQLIPKMREKFPRFHRVNGRVYLTTAYVTSLVGLFMVFRRGVLGGIPGHVAISLDGVLIIIFATIAYAMLLLAKLSYIVAGPCVCSWSSVCSLVFQGRTDGVVCIDWRCGNRRRNVYRPVHYFYIFWTNVRSLVVSKALFPGAGQR